MKVKDIIHGFEVTKITDLEEINARMYEMIHQKTQAKTIWLDRDDDNKTFSIAFKTTPTDDTGVFHILEHSVLNGSKRYPVKEPFVDLLKGSLQTFLNAITFPDKTCYPVSSRNKQDFINLIRVYLDAVFYPLVKENPNIFYQEGWHYELDDVNDKPSYKGVVFNEMKGAFSSADSLRSRAVMHSLFPDNCYGNESGGDPEYITDLTYEQFTLAHDKYYSPSNSYIFLDGNIDIEEILQIINDEYLNNFSYDDKEIIIPKQEAVIQKEVIQEFEISADSDTKAKAQIANAYVIGDFDEYEKIVGFSLISSVLCGNNEAPLNKLILDNGFGENIYFGVQNGIYQPYVEIGVINTDIEKAQQINDAIKDKLSEIVKEGIDRKELEAAINQLEFKTKEKEFGSMPKGLIFGLSVLDTWLYGGNPADPLRYNELFENIRAKMNTSYYEDLIEQFILNSKHCATVLLKPSNTLGQIKAEKEQAKLENISKNWTTEQKEEIVELNKQFKKWQASSDTAEQKATLPYLKLDDLDDKASHYPIEVTNYNDNIVLKHNQDTNGIAYVNLYIKANDLEKTQITTLGQMLSLLGKLKTEKYDTLTLNRMMKSILGDFAAAYTPRKSFADATPRNYIFISFSCLERNIEEAIELVKEILYHTDFTDSKAIQDILKQNIFSMEQSFINAGHILAIQRSAANSTWTSTISEYYAGYEGFKILKNLDDNYETLSTDFINDLKQLQKDLFIKQRYILSVSGNKQDEIVQNWFKDAPEGIIKKDVVIEPLKNGKDGIITPSNISYAAKHLAFDYKFENYGTMFVIGNILTYDYLWNEIRVKGGAYGCGQRTNTANTISFYSYRDPSPNNSFDVFTDTVKYLREFIDNKENVENYIVGTVGDFDPLLTSKTSIFVSDSDYLGDFDFESKQKIYSQILNTTLQDIEKAITLFEKVNEQNNICVVGNKNAIEECKDRLDNIFEYNQQ